MQAGASITGAATATAFTATYGTASDAQTFSISGSNLTASITATAPTGFEVSSDGTTYGSTATFTQSGGSATGSLRVRLAATAVPGGTYNSQNVALTSTGATTVNIVTASSGNSVSKATPSLSITSASSAVAGGNVSLTATSAAASVAVSASTGAITYTSSNTGVATISSTTLSAVAAGSTTITASQAADSNYEAASATQSFTVTAAVGSLATSTGSLSALTATTYGTASAPANFTVTGSGLNSSGVTVTPPVGFEVSGTSDFASVGTSASPLSLGTSATLNTAIYVRLAGSTVPGNYAGGITVAGGGASPQTVTIASSTVNTKSLTVSNPAVTSKAYDGTAAATITGSLSGVIAGDTVTLNGAGTFASVNAGTGINVTSTSTLGGTHAARYTLTQPTGLIGTINKASQSITFGALNPAVVGGSAITLSATANSSLTVAYASSDTAVAAVAGDTVTIVGTGSTTITATQAGDTNYNAAPSVTQTLNVVANAATTLAAGDLAVIGYQTSGTPDYFYVLVLKDLGPGTIFYVNDNEIAADGGTSFTDLAEGEASFTVKAGQAVAAGTVLNLPWGAAAVSTTQYDWSSNSGFGLGNNNEEIYIYTATAITATTPTGFIFGAKIGTSPSARPSGLTAGSTFISPTGSASRYKLTTAIYSGTAAQLLTAIGDTVTNWEGTAPAATTDWTFSITPPAATPPTITSTNAFAGTVGVSFSTNIIATGTAPIAFSGTGLPGGLSVASGGAITGTPTAAGTFTNAILTATNSAGTNNQTVTFTIGKGTPTIETNPVASAITVGEALSVSTLSGGTASVTGTFDWTSPSTVPVSTGYYEVTFTPTDTANYNTATTTVSVTVNPAGTIYSGWLNGASASDAAFLDYVFGAVTPGTLDPSLKPMVAVTGGNLVLTYYVRQGTVGLTVTPKTSADLAAGPSGWVTTDVTVADVGTPKPVNGVNVQQKTASVPVSGAKKFLRVEAVQE